jgi:DNA phosphorothioation-dependent restriction protein DptF
LEKIVSKAEYENPFYKAYSEQCLGCTANCPIKLNFEILQNSVVRTKISDLLIQCIVKHHHIISIRALYNFIFDLIVPAELDGLNRNEIVQWQKRASSGEYLQRLFVNHLFEHPEVSRIHSHLHSLDPALRRSSYLDDQIVSLITQENPEDQLKQVNDLESLQNILIQHTKEFKDDDILVKSYVRLLFFSDSNVVENQFGDSNYKDYMRLLYSWHIGDRNELKYFYKLIQRATMDWLGKAPSGEMLLDLGNQQLKYKLSEAVYIAPGPLPEENHKVEEVTKFSNILPLKFRSTSNDSIEFSLHVDFRLYEMARNVDSGCCANASDKSNFIAFTSFSHDVMKAGGQNRRLRITEAETGRGFLLEIDEFGDFTFNGCKD